MQKVKVNEGHIKKFALGQFSEKKAYKGFLRNDFQRPAPPISDGVGNEGKGNRTDICERGPQGRRHCSETGVSGV